MKSMPAATSYALGVVLYEMIAGQTPYRAETPMAVVLMHITAPLPPLRGVRPDVPEEVERVILKAMAKDPDDRFQTVREMMDAFDVAVQVAQKAFSVEPLPADTPAPPLSASLPPMPPPPKKAKPKWVWAAAGVAVLSIFCLIGLVVTMSFLPFKVQIRDGQIQVVRRAEMTPTLAWSPTPQTTKGTPLTKATETPPHPETTAPSQPTSIAGATPTVVSEATWTATATPQPAPAQTPTPQPTPLPWADVFVQLVVLDTGGYQAAFSPDGKLLAVSGQDLILYDTQNWQQVRTLGTDGAFGFAFSPDGQTLAAIVGEVKLYDVNTGAERLTLPGFEIHTTAASGYFMAFSPDGQWLAVVVDDVVKLFDANTGQELGLILAQGPHALALAPDGKTLVTAGWSSKPTLWDVDSGQQVGAFGEQRLGANRVLFSPDGATLVSSDVHDPSFTLWDVASRRMLRTFTGHTDAVNGLAFSPDGRLLATVSRDITIKIWDMATGQELQTMIGHSKEANSIAFSPDGAMVVSTSWDGTTRLWGLVPKEAASTPSSTQVSASPTTTPVPLAESAISPENASEVKQTRSLEQGGREVLWSPDGRLLAVAGHDLTVYNAQTWQQVRTIGRARANGIAFSPDSKTLAAIMGEVKLFDVTTGAELYTPPGTRISTSAWSGYFLSFSPDGRTLAVIVDNVVKLFDVESGREMGLMSNDN